MQWEIPPKETYPPYTFPTDDLLWKLVDLYFTHVNAQIPLLHRPSFVRAIRTGLHQRDRAYGATVLVVCALASRYSDDPRVFLEGADTELSAGWRWFRQVRSMRSPSLDPPTVYDLQLCCVSSFKLPDCGTYAVPSLLLFSSSWFSSYKAPTSVSLATS